MPTTLAVLSDTHGLLRPEVLPHLAGVDAILHAGDVVEASILDKLRQYAPVYAVRGNCDYGTTAHLPPTLLLEFGGWSVYMLHDLHELDITPEAAGVNIIVSGHTHKPLSEQRGDVLYLNPASCGPKRFSLPISMMKVILPDDVSVEPQISFIELVK